MSFRALYMSLSLIPSRRHTFCNGKWTANRFVNDTASNRIIIIFPTKFGKMLVPLVVKLTISMMHRTIIANTGHISTKPIFLFLLNNCSNFAKSCRSNCRPFAKCQGFRFLNGNIMITPPHFHALHRIQVQFQPFNPSYLHTDPRRICRTSSIFALLKARLL